MKRIIIYLALLQGLLVPGADAGILITEFLADPPLGLLGDVNLDGVRHSSQDEFVEILNDSANSHSLLGWQLSDATSQRHVFGNVMLDPGARFVIFGGGLLGNLAIQATIASTGRLSLNNSGDTVRLLDSEGNLIDELIYGPEANNDQSWVRFPEPSGNWVAHSSASLAGAPYSPGISTNQKTAATAPEPKTVALILCGIVLGLLRKFKTSSR